MTAVPRSLPLDPRSVATSTTVYPSDYWLEDRQRAFGKRHTVVVNSVLNAGYAESSDSGAKSNCRALALAPPRSTGKRKRRLIIHCAILCVFCPTVLGAGVVGGALIAENQPVSLLEPGGFSLEVPRFRAAEENAGRTPPQGPVPTAPEALPKLAM